MSGLWFGTGCPSSSEGLLRARRQVPGQSLETHHGAEEEERGEGVGMLKSTQPGIKFLEGTSASQQGQKSPNNRDWDLRSKTSLARIYLSEQFIVALVVSHHEHKCSGMIPQPGLTNSIHHPILRAFNDRKPSSCQLAAHAAQSVILPITFQRLSRSRLKMGVC